eukprot:PhM_4_TR924/c0_g1_i1/m.35661/K03145/TFIIS; transcription elongation factor S-II
MMMASNVRNDQQDGAGCGEAEDGSGLAATTTTTPSSPAPTSTQPQSTHVSPRTPRAPVALKVPLKKPMMPTALPVAPPKHIGVGQASPAPAPCPTTTLRINVPGLRQATTPSAPTLHMTFSTPQQKEQPKKRIREENDDDVNAEQTVSMSRRESTVLIRNNTLATMTGSSSSSDGGSLPSHRLAMREQLRSSLELNRSECVGDATSSVVVAAEIETALFELQGTPLEPGAPAVTADQVRAKFRTIVYNLKDSKNEPLRDAVLRRDIAPNALVRMSSHQLANPELQKARQEEKETHLERIKTANHVRGNRTNYFTCGRCKKNETIFTEMQTARGDEASTKFVTCLNCNFSWKFR